VFILTPPCFICNILVLSRHNTIINVIALNMVLVAVLPLMTIRIYGSIRHCKWVNCKLLVFSKTETESILFIANSVHIYDMTIGRRYDYSGRLVGMLFQRLVIRMCSQFPACWQIVNGLLARLSSSTDSLQVVPTTCYRSAIQQLVNKLWVTTL
jgi:hypothetical protein